MMTNRNELIKAAEMLKANCAAHAGNFDCGDCVFWIHKVSGHICGLTPPDDWGETGELPDNWQLPKPRRFTDDDIALAKALKAFGAGAIGKGDSSDPAFWTIGKYTVDKDFAESIRRDLPERAFASLNSFEMVLIDEIIAEGEE